MRKVFTVLCILAMASLVMAHPHFQKTVTTKIGEIEVKITYTTTPANMERIKDVQVGAYNAGYGTLTLAADLTVSSTTVKAGDYTIGAIMNGTDDWTMALYQGKVPRGETPDMSKVIKLNSMFSNSQGTADHVFFDIMPGHGLFEGKTVLIWHFGSLYLAGLVN